MLTIKFKHFLLLISQVVKLAWSKEQLSGQRFPEEWYMSVLGFEEVINNRNVLVCWLGGKAVEVSV